METIVLGITLILYSALFFTIMGIRFANYIKFKKDLRCYSRTTLMDSLYEGAIYIVFILLIAIYSSEIIDVFLDLKGYLDWNMPFIVYAMPLMFFTFDILVKEGLYAYDDNMFYIGWKIGLPKDKIKINSVHKYNIIKRAKIVISTKGSTNHRYVIRTSISNLQLFMDTLKA